MNSMNNNRFVFWAIILLVVVNFSALTAYFFYGQKPTGPTEPKAIAKSGIVLSEELALTPEQTTKVNQINKTYQATSQPIVEAIREKKAELIDELTKEDTDTVWVDSLANHVVKEQKKLQMANIKQFIDLKKVCSPQQTQKLSQIYAELYGCENSCRNNGQGKGMGHRHRYGRQSGNK